jgi:predicted dienelactone hydrolase
LINSRILADGWWPWRRQPTGGRTVFARVHLVRLDLLDAPVVGCTTVAARANGGSTEGVFMTAASIAGSRGFRFLAIAALACVGLGFDGCWTTADLSAPGRFGIGVRLALPLVDDERERSLPVSLWYPTAGAPGIGVPDAAPSPDGPFPLIVLAHGLGDSPTTLSPLAAHLASHGFVVAAPKFPGSILGDPVLELVNDIVNHPADVSLVIDAALGIGEPFPVDLTAVIDRIRIGMAGLSNGGLATYLTTFDRARNDRRIRVAVTLAGGGGDQFTERFFRQIGRRVPLLIVHGTADALIPYDPVAEAVFDNAPVPLVRLTLIGGSHVGYSTLVPTFPNTHPDTIGCLFFPPIDTDDPEAGVAFEYLASRRPDTGVEIDLDTPLPCTFGAEDLPWMEPARQEQLTHASVLAFLLGHFGDSAAERSNALEFLETLFELENDDVVVEAQPGSWSYQAYRGRPRDR